MGKAWDSLLVFFLLLPFLARADQSPLLDSLRQQLAAAPPDTAKVDILNQLAAYYSNADSAKTARYTEEAIALARKLGYQRGEAVALYRIGWATMMRSDYGLAMRLFERSRRIAEHAADSAALAGAFAGMGAVFRQQGLYQQALDFYLKALTIDEQMDDPAALASSYNNIGHIYSAQRNFELAKSYYDLSYQTHAQNQQRQGMAYSLSSMGFLFQQMGIADSAIEYFQRSQAVPLQDRSLKAYNLDGLGNAFQALGDYAKAANCYQQAYDLRRAMGQQKGIATSLTNLGMAQTRLGKFAQAEQHLGQALALAEEIRTLDVLKLSTQALAELYEAKGQTEQSYAYFRRYVRYKDSLLNENQTRELARLEARYAFEQEKDSLNRASQLALEKEQLQSRYRGRINLIALGLLTVLLALAIILYSNRQTLKRVVASLQQTEQELLAQRDFIETQNEELTYQQQKVESSIRSALAIQQAMLPFQERMRELLGAHLLLYLPRDIVSGDFYWIEERAGSRYLVVADCTGHGIPGAFMSLIGINLLSKIIMQDREEEPAQILTALNDQLNKALHQQDGKGLNSGMDIALIKWQQAEHDMFAVTFAGAKRPLYYWRNGQIHECRGSRRSIGGVRRAHEPYGQVSLLLPTGTLIYLFTDGYTDQNNAQRRSFGSRRFKKLLSQVAALPFAEQESYLQQTLQTYMQDTTQRDDILLIGARL